MRNVRTRARTTLAAIAICIPLIASCSDSGSDASSKPSPSAAAAQQLVIGKGDQALTPGAYISPEGFAPGLLVTLAGEWTSVHRAADAFDLSRADTTADAPLVAIVVAKPAEKTATAAISAIRSRAKGIKRDVTRTLLGVNANGIEVTGGNGSLIRSSEGSIELDAATHGVVRAYAVDTGKGLVLVVVYIPDVTKDATVSPDVDAVLASLTVQN